MLKEVFAFLLTMATVSRVTQFIEFVTYKSSPDSKALLLLNVFPFPM